ncbi:MAG TPA: alpha/beta fold hydrolase [Burkholderiales bacterium]|nr:alpha/beta fold hydrolase [Burkholderiales bacterium]
MTERVVMVHGLWMHGVAMMPLGWRLSRCGFTVAHFSYRSVRRPLEENARRLADLLQVLDAQTLHVVGHSLGGIVALRALALRNEPRVRRVVLMGSPLAGSIAGRGLARFRAGRWMLGQSLPLWSDRSPPEVPPGVEIGVIAGCLPLGLGRLFARLPEPNDGVAVLDEAQHPDAVDSIVLRTNHTGMLLSARVAQQICTFLRDGRFGHD